MTQEHHGLNNAADDPHQRQDPLQHQDPWARNQQEDFQASMSEYGCMRFLQCAEHQLHLYDATCMEYGQLRFSKRVRELISRAPFN